MAATQSLDTIPVEVKAYFIVIHAALFLIIAALVYSRKTLKENEPEKTSGKRKAKTVAVENKEITIESCEWVNSTLGWLYSNSKGTPKAMELWIASLNAELRKTNQSKEKIHIEGLIPGSLPPHVPSVYCLRVDGKMQCVTFHVEAKEFGFLVSIDQQDYTSTLLVSVIKLKGELTVQADKTDEEIDVSARFIGEPEIVLYTKVKDGKDGVSTAAVEERMKEVITKTVTSVPITESSPTSKDDISAIPQSITCLGEDGKILVKVIKGSDLSSCDEEVKEPYCVISCADPPQKKRTTKKKEANNPYWNEYFILNVNKSTQEVIFDLYDHQKAPYDSDYHFNDREDGIETDDFLGQVVVPLAAINRDQTCRLIFPVLPKSQKSQYVTGQLTIEFTFDKDGKVIDGAIPLTSRTKIVEDIITTTTETVTETLVDGTLTNRTTSKTVTVNGDETDHISQDSESIELDNGVLETELIALEAVVNGHDKDAEKEEQRMEEVLSNPMDHVETQMELEILEAVVNQLDREEDEEKKNHKDDKDETTGVITVTQETTEKTIILTEPVVITQEETQEDVKEEEEEEKEEEEIPPTIVVPLDESPSKERLSKAEEEQTEEVEDEQAKEETIAETSTQTKKTKKTRKVFTFKKHKHAKQEEPHEGEEKKEEEKEEEKIDEPEKKDELAVEPSPKPKKMKKHWSFRSKKNKEAEDEEKLNLEATEDEAAKEEPEEKIEEETEETKEEPEEKKDEEEEKPKKGKRHWGFHSKKGKGPADKEPEEPKEEAQKEETIKEEDEEEKQEEEEVDKKEETEEKAEDEEEKLKKGKKHWGFHSKKGKEPAEKAPEEHKEEEAKEEEAKEEEAKEEEEEKKDEEKKEDEAEPSPKPEKTKKVKKAWTFHGKRHKDEKPDHDKEEQKPGPVVVVTNGDATDDENKENLDENPNEPSVSQASTPEPVKPRKARSFHFRHKQRPVSMIETSDNKPGMSKDLSKRHSFHEGDKPPKSGSKDQLSVLSYSPSTHSSLVIETTKKEYYHIPPVMAKRGTYEQKGNKLHIYNDHVFSAIHFSGDMPNCAVCGSALGGSLLAIGKQGYECRDCKIAVHKRCHFMTSSVCPSSSIKKMEIKSVPSFVR